MLGVPHIEFGGDHNFGRLAPHEREKIRAILSKKFFIMSDHEQAGFKTYRSSMLDATLTKPYCLAGMYQSQFLQKEFGSLIMNSWKNRSQRLR